IFKPKDLRTYRFVIWIITGTVSATAAIICDCSRPRSPRLGPRSGPGGNLTRKKNNWIENGTTILVIRVCHGVIQDAVAKQPFSHPLKLKIGLPAAIRIDSISYQRNWTLRSCGWLVAGRLAEEGNLVTPLLSGLHFFSVCMSITV